MRDILGTNHSWNVAMVGVGNLGQALLGYRGFGRQNFAIAAAFDADPAKVGQPCGHLTILDSRELPTLIEENQVIVGVVAVPAEAAQDVADELVRAGIRIVFNYSGALIDVPPHVTAHTTSPAVELLYALYFHLA